MVIVRGGGGRGGGVGSRQGSSSGLEEVLGG